MLYYKIENNLILCKILAKFILSISDIRLKRLNTSRKTSGIDKPISFRKQAEEGL